MIKNRAFDTFLNIHNNLTFRIIYLIDFKKYKKIIFFTGAGMSAESGVPTYRGQGGVWAKYNFREYACQDAFDINPEKVLSFHEIRRKALFKCHPHRGHKIIADLQKQNNEISIVTQNIDGMHQKAGSINNIFELHGSIWRLRCSIHRIYEDFKKQYKTYKCEKCGNYLRPDIIWFGDSLDHNVTEKSIELISDCDLFISIGTSGVVWPAAGFPEIAKNNNAFCVEINPEPSAISELYDKIIRKPASIGLKEIFS